MKKSRVLKSWSKRNLPSELWPEILSRLPVRSVLRFRSVSKSWRSMIDDPNFCRLHLTNFKNNLNETHLFFVQGLMRKNDNAKICAVRSCNTFKTTATLDSLDTTKLGEKWDLICSMDGLFMIQYGQHGTPTHELILWNPSIRRSIILPPSPPISEQLWNIDLGFGFSPSINDYKLVRLVLHGYHNLRSISVYTIGTGLWKTIEFHGREVSDWRWTYDYDSRWKVVCFRGALYFTAKHRILGGKEKCELVSFDLDDEVFGFTALPIDDDILSDECADAEDIISDESAVKTVTLVDGGSSLGVVYLLSTFGCIWVLESDGEWTKRFIFNSVIQELFQEDYTRPNLLCISKNREMFFQWFPLQVTSYNLESGDEKNLIRSFRRPDMIYGCVFIESLVLLNA